MAFELPKLKYDHSKLEPYIDGWTMEVHHGKHHAGYTKKLNAAIADTDLAGKSIEDILSGLDMSNNAVRNNGGGFYNHSLFWNIMSPNGGGEAEGDLSASIKDSFGSFNDFKSEFKKAATGRFGSGWAWLCVKEGGKLDICSSANQDNPLMPEIGCGGNPILGLDVWEHAYYLNYQNRRGDYVDAFFNVVDWEEVGKRFKKG